MPPVEPGSNSTPPHLDPGTYPRTTSNAALNAAVTLTYGPLDANAALQATASAQAGANVVFVGTTRDSFEGRRVAQLSYTAYAPLALKTLMGIAEEAVRSHELLGVYIAHRLGNVPVGEASIVVAVSAAHRGAVWSAGERLLEECKAKAEIWKEEVFVDGAKEWRANRDRDSRGNLLHENHSP